jgi:hypothetical protein
MYCLFKLLSPSFAPIARSVPTFSTHIPFAVRKQSAPQVNPVGDVIPQPDPCQMEEMYSSGFGTMLR